MNPKVEETLTQRKLPQNLQIQVPKMLKSKEGKQLSSQYPRSKSLIGSKKFKASYISQRHDSFAENSPGSIRLDSPLKLKSKKKSKNVNGKCVHCLYL